MNLKRSGRVLVLAAAVAMLAMSLQGCGGDDGVSQERLDEEIAKTAAAEKARMEAEAAKAKADKDRMAAQAAEAEARKATTEAQAATAAAEKATIAAKAAETAAKNSPENARLKKAVEEARAELKRLEKEAADRKADADRKAAHAQAEKDRVTMTAAGARRGKSTGFSLAEMAANAMTTRIQDELKLTSSTLKAEFPGYQQDDTMRPRELTDFAGWSGATLVKTGNEKDTIVVHTNQRKKVLLSSLFSHTSVPGTGDTYRLVANGGLRNHGKGDAGQAVSTSGTDNTLPGKLLGIPGTFKCSGAAAGGSGACRIGSSAAAGHTVIGNNWTFTPTDANAMAYGDYSFFGWWMNDTPAAFDVFYKYAGTGWPRNTPSPVGYSNPGSGRQDVLGAVGIHITGTTTYTGPAAGRYAIRNPLVEDGTESGAFTARARLSLDFDGDSWERPTYSPKRVDQDGILITGTIDQFKGTHAGIDKWKVKLTVDGSTGRTGTVGQAGRTAGLQTIDYLGQGDPVDWGPDGRGLARFMAEWSLDDGSTYISDTVKSGQPGHYASEGTDPQPTGRFTAEFYGGGTVNRDWSEPPETAVGRFNASISNLAELMGAFAVTKD